METKERFWDPIPAPGNKLADYCLAILSQLSYDTDDEGLERWAQIFNMPIRSVVLTPGILIPNFVIAGHTDRLIVAIPGTKTLSQMFENIWYSAQRENSDFGPGRIHSFFLWCAEGIVDFIRDRLELFPSLQQVTFVGHSLGGAVAQLLADWTAANTSITVKQCVTFNSPRVGDGLWSRRSRPYPTVNYYSTHDMVCELPPLFSPSATAWQTDLGIIDGYIHRGETTPDGTPPEQDALVPIISARDISETWWSAIAGKIGLVSGNAGARTFAAETARKVFENLARISGRVYAASWLLPLPVWIDEHRMLTMCENFAIAIEGIYLPERANLKNLRDYLAGREPDLGPFGYSSFQATNYPNPILPPMHFALGTSFGSGRIEDLPTPIPGTRFEAIEASFEWIVSDSETALPGLISVDDRFLAAFAEADVGPRGTGPMTVTAPIPVDVPERPHWLFRGDDRRILEALLTAMDLVEARDELALGPTPTSRLSTRETIVDWDNGELVDFWFAIRSQVAYLLGLAHED